MPKLTISISSIFVLMLTNFVADAAPLIGQGVWQETLHARDLDGDDATIEAYYDSLLNITWLANANAGAGSPFDNDLYHTSQDGIMVWTNANDWAASLQIGGVTGWRLPTSDPLNGSNYTVRFAADGSRDHGVNISAPGSRYEGSTASELAHMFYVTLGNSGYLDLENVHTGCGVSSDTCLTNSGPFLNLQTNFSYWSATEYVVNTDLAWMFTMSHGEQFMWNKTHEDGYAWAVHDGDVGLAVVPLPSALWFFCTGILGALGVIGRKITGSEHSFR